MSIDKSYIGIDIIDLIYIFQVHKLVAISAKYLISGT